MNDIQCGYALEGAEIVKIFNQYTATYNMTTYKLWFGLILWNLTTGLTSFFVEVYPKEARQTDVYNLRRIAPYTRSPICWRYQ